VLADGRAGAEVGELLPILYGLRSEMITRLGVWMLAALVAVACSACNWTSPSAEDDAPTSSQQDEGGLVTVPRVTHTDIVSAYDVLHEAGLRVEIPERFEIRSLQSLVPASQDPRPGVRVPVGSVVSLTLRTGPLGSPASSPHTVQVANLVGRSASAAIGWVENAELFFEIEDVPPLLPSDAAHLFDAYRVTHQSPAPGTRLGPGVLQDGTFVLTPMILTVAPCTRRGLAVACGSGGLESG
jgi:hypothetical protein